MMRDVSVAKESGVSGERAVNKIQDFQYDEVLFGYCILPEVSQGKLLSLCLKIIW